MVKNITDLDLTILKYYSKGGEMSGFEKDSPWENLVKLGYLDDDLELTSKGCSFIKLHKNWDEVVSFIHTTKPTIEQAKKDLIEFNQYLKEMESKDKRLIPKSFKEMFGYEIIYFFETGETELRGERYVF